MAALLGALTLLALAGLDWKGKISLTHPVGLIVTGVLYLTAVVYAAALVLAALVETAGGTPRLSTWVGAGVLALVGNLFALYVVGKAHLCPLGRKKGGTSDKAARLLADGLALGLPLQILLIGGYAAASLALQQVFEGPFWMVPLYPLAVAALWPMCHLVFHVALVAWMLDPVILLAAWVIGLFWTAQSLFLLHGVLRSAAVQRTTPGKTVLWGILCFFPVVNLILAAAIRKALKTAGKEAAV